MNEIESICKAAALSRAAGEPCWLASVVRVRGSAYRRAGARLLFTREAPLAGSISAGCLESTLVRSGSFFAEKRATLQTFEAPLPDDDDPRTGTGCGGSVDLLVEPVIDRYAEVLDFIGTALAEQERVAMVSVIRSGGRAGKLGARVVRSANQSLSFGCELGLETELELLARATLDAGPARARRVRLGAFELLLELLEPSTRLFVFGAGPDVPPLVTIATQLGWETTVVSHRDRPTLRERFVKLPCRYVVSDAQALVPIVSASARAVAVVMSHDYANDRDTLGALLTAKLDYLGVLGPRARTEQLLKEPASRGLAALEARRRVHAPVGLDIGAETAPEIALAIAAEAQAYLRRADGRSRGNEPAPRHVAPFPGLEAGLAEAAE